MPRDREPMNSGKMGLLAVEFVRLVSFFSLLMTCNWLQLFSPWLGAKTADLWNLSPHACACRWFWCSLFLFLPPAKVRFLPRVAWVIWWLESFTCWSRPVASLMLIHFLSYSIACFSVSGGYLLAVLFSCFICLFLQDWCCLWRSWFWPSFTSRYQVLPSPFLCVGPLVPFSNL